MASRLVHSSSSSSSSSSLPTPSPAAPVSLQTDRVDGDLPVPNGPTELRRDDAAEPPEEDDDAGRAMPLACLPQVVVLREQRHDGFDEAAAAAAGPSTSGPVSKWRPKDRVMDVQLLPPTPVVDHFFLTIATPSSRLNVRGVTINTTPTSPKAG